ncbi:MAG: hypothetical protein AB7L13_19385 [Acidimicrobiia bacterium]
MIATVVTALALPYLVHEITKKGSESPVGAASPVAGVQVGLGSSTTLAPTAAPAATPATQAGPPTHISEGKVGFRLYDPTQWGARACAGSGIPVNAKVIIANLNNGKTTTCTIVNDARGVGKDHLLELSDTVFAEIADPTVGVIPARIAW